MFDQDQAPGDGDNEIVDLVDDLIDELKPKIPKNCSTCRFAQKLCRGCWCSEKPTGVQCYVSGPFGRMKRSRAWLTSFQWRADGAEGDCPVWRGDE